MNDFIRKEIEMTLNDFFGLLYDACVNFQRFINLTTLRPIEGQI